MKTELYFIELSEYENFTEYERYIKLLSLDKQTQVYKFRFEIDRKLSLLSDLFVRYLVCKILNLNNADLAFCKNAYGKPYLAGFPDFQFNISHTRSAIAIGISDKSIGVDIEKIKSSDLKIAERFFCKNEFDYILSSEERREKLFCKVWTEKEAYIKWVGKGLSIPLDAFDTTDTELSKILSSIEIDGYIVSVCGKMNFDKSELNKLNENQMSRIFSEFVRNTV